MGPTSPDVKEKIGPKLGRDVGGHVNDLPYKRLQVSGRVPEDRGGTLSDNPQLPSCVDNVPSGHFGGKVFSLSLPFLIVQNRVVLHEL